MTGRSPNGHTNGDDSRKGSLPHMIQYRCNTNAMQNPHLSMMTWILLPIWLNRLTNRTRYCPSDTLRFLA